MASARLRRGSVQQAERSVVAARANDEEVSLFGSAGQNIVRFALDCAHHDLVDRGRSYR